MIHIPGFFQQKLLNAVIYTLMAQTFTANIPDYTVQ